MAQVKTLAEIEAYAWPNPAHFGPADYAAARLTPDDIFTSTQTALVELALSGCTTASDHLYLFPNGSRLDDEILAAREVGLRLQASRGSMSLGESQGGLPPDRVVESEDAILRDTQRVIETYHDSSPYAMLRIVVAPCSPFSVSPALMRRSMSCMFCES